MPDLDAALAGCPALCALNVNGCIGLHRLSLAAQPVLERLEASGCKCLAAVVCANPLLHTFLAQACPRLQASSSMSLVRFLGLPPSLDIGPAQRLLSWLDVGEEDAYFTCVMGIL